MGNPDELLYFVRHEALRFDLQSVIQFVEWIDRRPAPAPKPRQPAKHTQKKSAMYHSEPWIRPQGLEVEVLSESAFTTVQFHT